MKILITGTHFTPAQAVIEELQKFPNTQIVYLGRKFTQEGDRIPSVESQVLPKMGIKFIPLVTGRIRRIFDIQTVFSLFKIPIGFIQAFYFVVKENPDVVLSFGGYTGVPIVFSSWLLSKPIIIHEQTLVSGLANRVSGFFADKIAVSFQTDYPFDKKKVILTGNPIRKEFLGEKNESDGIPTIYVTGGNQGSHIINQTIEEKLNELTKNYHVFHQTGDSKFKDFERLSLKREKMKYKNRYLVKKWFDSSEVKEIFKKASLVISRAGANTLLELAYFGIPAIIIPLPYLYKNEQMINARYFQKLGLCKVLTQDSLSSDTLLKQIKAIFSKFDIIKREASRARNIVIDDSAQRVAQEVLTLATSNDKKS